MDVILFYSRYIVNSKKERIRNSLSNPFSYFEVSSEKKLKNGEPLYTVNQVRIRLKKSHHSVKKYIESGILRTTANGLIPESAIEEFLRNNHNK